MYPDHGCRNTVQKSPLLCEYWGVKPRYAMKVDGDEDHLGWTIDLYRQDFLFSYLDSRKMGEHIITSGTIFDMEKSATWYSFIRETRTCKSSLVYVATGDAITFCSSSLPQSLDLRHSLCRCYTIHTILIRLRPLRSRETSAILECREIRRVTISTSIPPECLLFVMVVRRFPLRIVFLAHKKTLSVLGLSAR